MDAPTPRECEHGQLARQCEICELRRELAAKTEDAEHFFQLSGRYLERANKAEEELERVKELHADLMHVKDELITQYIQDNVRAEAEAEALRKAVSKYGKHVDRRCRGGIVTDPATQMDTDDDGMYCCGRCNGSGEIMVCIDDMCQGAGECMHGDGMIICPACKGSGE